MTKYFRMEEITENDFEEMTGVSQGLACQTVVHVDGAVYISVEDSKEEITVPMDIFED